MPTPRFNPEEEEEEEEGFLKYSAARSLEDPRGSLTGSSTVFSCTLNPGGKWGIGISNPTSSSEKRDENGAKYFSP